ncbi:MAG: hypothetical protein IJ689_04435 [Alphaproteobacteria bacterium]|nr:hypothetical protein [Alphaproteobacteria bacterium]
MNKYILMLGVTGIVLGSYASYASNSATMTVTATIAHDVSLNILTNPNLGTITINPASSGVIDISYNKDTGEPGIYTDTVVDADYATAGTFTANIPNPEACNGDPYNDNCKIQGQGVIGNCLGNSGGTDCIIAFKYTGSSNLFKIIPLDCWANDASRVVPGTHTTSITISYTPEA